MHSPRDGVDEGGRLRPPFFVFGCRRRCGSGRWPDVPFRCLLPSLPSAAFPSLMSGLPHQRRRHEAKMWRAAEVDISFHRFALPLLRHLVISPCQGEADRNGKRIGRCFHRPLPVASTSLMSTLFPTEATGRSSDDRNGLMPASVAFLAVLHRHLMLSRRGQRYETKTRGATKEGGRDMPRLLSGRRWRGATRLIPVVLGLHLVFPRFSCRCPQTTGPILTNWSE